MILKYIFVFGICYFLGLYSHGAFLAYKNVSVTFSLQSVYFFNAIFSFLLCVIFLLLSKNKKIAAQLGFLYLGSLMLKFFIFTLLFKDIIFESVVLSRIETFSIIIPTLFFLFLEVFFVVKIIRYTEHYYK